MKQLKAFRSIAFLSTFPPRECGIATFTEDLITTMDRHGIVNTHVIAISNSDNCSYDKKVMAEIKQNEQSDYIDMAKKLNESHIDLLVIEHEYGIYGGDHGDYILDLVNNLDIPIVTTLHTVLSEPSTKQKFIINGGCLSARVLARVRPRKNHAESARASR
jgi:hypothetical protein